VKTIDLSGLVNQCPWRHVFTITRSLDHYFNKSPEVSELDGRYRADQKKWEVIFPSRKGRRLELASEEFVFLTAELAGAYLKRLHSDGVNALRWYASVIRRDLIRLDHSHIAELAAFELENYGTCKMFGGATWDLDEMISSWKKHTRKPAPRDEP
jgi:hypothetical protein